MLTGDGDGQKCDEGEDVGSAGGSDRNDDHVDTDDDSRYSCVFEKSLEKLYNSRT